MLAVGALMEKSLTLRGAGQLWPHKDWRKLLAWMEEGRIAAPWLITHTFPLSEGESSESGRTEQSAIVEPLRVCFSSLSALCSQPENVHCGTSCLVIWPGVRCHDTISLLVCIFPCLQRRERTTCSIRSRTA